MSEIRNSPEYQSALREARGRWWWKLLNVLSWFGAAASVCFVLGFAFGLLRFYFQLGIRFAGWFHN